MVEHPSRLGAEQLGNFSANLSLMIVQRFSRYLRKSVIENQTDKLVFQNFLIFDEAHGI